MKTSSIVASVLFGSMAAAAPMLNKRAYVTHTSTLVQTEMIYTTVYADEVPQASEGAFYEKSSKHAKPTVAPAPVQPSLSTAAPVQPSTAAPPVQTPAVPSQPSAPVQPPVVQSPPPQAPVPTTTEVPQTTQAPVPAPEPITTQAPPAVPEPSSEAPAPAPAPSAPATPPSSGGGETHSGGSLTIHEFGGALGSCGKPIADTDNMVALGSDLYGPSTYNVMTGEPTNKYCGMPIKITYNGKTADATIMDKCEGCTNGGLDVTKALWKELTGTDVGDRLQGMSWTAA